MENRNIIRTLCDCTPSKKQHGSSGLTPRYIEYQIVKKVSKLWQKSLEQHNVNFKN